MTLKKRELKGIRIVVGNNVRPIDQSKFLVRSQSKPNKWYEVTWNRGSWRCSCDDHRRRNTRCKHIYAVCYYQMLRNVMLSVDNLELEPYCPRCHSRDLVVKSGFRYNQSGPVHRYYCKRCKKWFTDRTGFEGMKNQAVTIASALDLYYRGLSLRQIAEHLESFYGVKVSYGTIYYWLRKYVELIHHYLGDLQAKTSERWHADDTVIKVRGRHLILWSLLDSKTRFLIALHISRRKSSEDASSLFRKGRESSQNEPLEVVTDGLSSYGEAIEKEFKGVIHILGPLMGPLNNNKVERFFGVLKQRIKAMYHLNNEESAEIFAKGFPIYYNFIKTHKALNNMTPAEAAGILNHKSRWIDLILKAKNNIDGLDENAVGLS